MKTDKSKVLAAIAARQAADQNINLLIARQEKASRDLQAAIDAADLDDEAALQSITKLTTLVQLIPGKMASLEQKADAIENELVKTVHAFISEQLAPAINKAEKSHEQELKTTLGLQSQQEVEQAFRLSSRGRTLADLSLTATVRYTEPGGAISYAEQMLKVADKL